MMGSVLLFLAKIVEINVAEVGTKQQNLLFAAELFTLQLFSTFIASLYR